ncbi:MAG: 50S ribosomal protein L35 [bacterium]
MKLKTNKAISGRFKKTGSGKLKKITCGQGHFNTRETGKVGRNKKSDKVDSCGKKVIKTINTYLAK